jgi:4-hydroxyphenylpyruvate dioxygenase
LYRGLETGERNVVCHAVRQNKIIFVFKSALNPDDKEIGHSLSQHGDCVKDVSFSVNDIDYLVEKAKEHGAIIVKPVWQESDENGFVKMATLQTVCEKQL